MRNGPHNLRVIVQRDQMRDPFGSGLFFCLIDKASPTGEGGLGASAICTKMTFERLTPDEMPPESCEMHLPIEGAQELMEALWNAGIRPAQAAGSIGQLAAVEKHLADMREIARHKLGLKS